MKRDVYHTLFPNGQQYEKKNNEQVYHLGQPGSNIKIKLGKLLNL